ncbi:restriction endonuclease subunit S [Sulfoacidibacillus thermotolerans]|uniref:Type I restriction modification DNA specificity domain-containing protein n=1 Tax=Sulfoacidibacillus thermotolerans TaxID=1765684 RepID=A0A2U3D5Y3_SULT2|nr:restriction endonuclease subunit S [Sulfoacidibacillus thermotolerans]PWI56692.1 hypothetical protein BM613_12485 [Sulfoacidibacillus thermotolerans]
MSWREAYLSDLVFFQRGYDITKDKQVEGDVPVISSSGVSSYHAEAMAKGPGVVIGRKGSLGSVHYSEHDYWPHDTTLWSKDLKGNDAKYVYYYLKTLHLENFNVGNSNPTLNRNHIHNLRVMIPELSVQRSISSCLSHYDDLIEINRRRIELLEQAARLLYKEWFVHFRFPGHEHVKIVDGVPVNWERKSLGQVAPLQYGKALKAENRVDGPNPVFGSSGVVGYHATSLVEGPAIIVGRKGNVGSVFWSDSDCYPIDTVYFIDKSRSSLFLYYSLLNMNFISTDVAVPGLNRDFAHSREVLVPDEKIIDEFHRVVVPIYQQISVLEKYNSKLARARDLLLPRLMNGEIAI